MCVRYVVTVFSIFLYTPMYVVIDEYRMAIYIAHYSMTEVEELYKSCKGLEDSINPIKEVNRQYQQVIDLNDIIKCPYYKLLALVRNQHFLKFV